jgi:hypothetical protein
MLKALLGDTNWSAEDITFIKTFTTTKYDKAKTKDENEKIWRTRMEKKYTLLMNRLHNYIILRTKKLPHYTKNWIPLCELLDSICDEQAQIAMSEYKNREQSRS